MTGSDADGPETVAPAEPSPSPIRVLLVDNEPGFADTAAALVEERDNRLDVTSESDPAAALASSSAASTARRRAAGAGGV
jgi:hypothetical protein